MNEWNFYRTRGSSVVLLHRRRGGEEGIYRCVIPDEMDVVQTAYIGLYSNNTGEMFVGHAQLYAVYMHVCAGIA